MARATAASSKKEVSKKEEVKKVEEKKVEVVETPKKEEVVEAPAAEAEVVESQSIVEEVQKLGKNVKNFSQYAMILFKQVQALEKKVRRLENENNSLKSKKTSVRRRGSNNGLRQEIPVYSAEFSEFIKRHSDLKDKDGKTLIFESVHTDDKNHVMVTREKCLKLLNSYIRAKGLQKFPEDRKRVELDSELSKFLTKIPVRKNIPKGCFYFQDLMGALSPLLKAN